MLNRFKDAAVLRDALMSQRVVRGNEAVATEIAEVAELLEIEKATHLIHEGSSDNALLMILAGSVEIRVSGRLIALREAGETVGEMSLIDTSAKRSADVVARERSVVARVDHLRFLEIGQRNADLWRLLAIELGDRLRQRNVLVPERNRKPVMFIGSSTESLEVAEEIKAILEGPDLEVRIWSEGVFTPSEYTLDDLHRQVQSADFASLVFGPDDRIFSRGEESSGPRDNVVFELGLFMGAISRSRTFVVTPASADLKIPSDLLGLTLVSYADAGEKNLSERLSRPCRDIGTAVAQMGPL